MGVATAQFRAAALTRAPRRIKLPAMSDKTLDEVLREASETATRIATGKVPVPDQVTRREPGRIFFEDRPVQPPVLPSDRPR